MSEKHLGLGAIAALRPQREPLDDQMRDWNAMVGPKWAYPKQQKTNYARDRKSALARLMQPAYQLPIREETYDYDDVTFKRDSRHDHTTEPSHTEDA